MTRHDGLWAAIYDLYCLLIDRVNDEASYQRVFERHNSIFSVLGIDIVSPFEKSSSNKIPYDPERNFRPEPDFIGAELPAGNIAVVDLKTPFVGEITTSRQDGNRAKFKASAESYISQTTEYVESIRQRPEARDAVKRVLGLDRVADYRAILVYGLAAENDATLISTLLSQRKIPTEIIFYDQLFDRMIDAYSRNRSDSQARPGLCFVSHLHLAAMQIHKRAFLAEYGGADSDRVSVYLEDNEVIFECCDARRNVHRLSAPLTGLGPHYIRFEFSNDEQGVYMSLNVNNVETDLRLGRSILSLFPDTELFTLGADSNGARGAHFFMQEHYLLARTMSIDEKLLSYRHFQMDVGAPSHCIELKPESYMIKDGRGLVQDREEFKPVLRAWPPTTGA